MNKYEEILEWIKAGTDHLIVAMLAIMYYVIQAEGMSAEHLTDIMTKISMSFNTSTNILTSGETTYTINDLLHTTITTLYPKSMVITPEFILFSLYKLKRYSYITAEQYTTLKSELANA